MTQATDVDSGESGPVGRHREKIRRCPTVLTDEGWSQVEGLLPKRQMETEPERRYSR